MRARTLLLLLALPLAAQTFEITPDRVLSDEVAAIRAAGLQPSQRVAIKASLIDGADAHWSSHADFVADASGSIDTSKQAPAAGTYKEVSAMGLIWSMAPESKHVARYLRPRNAAPQTIDFELKRKDGSPLTARLTQVEMSPLVERIPVHDGSLRGAFFVPRETGKHAAVLVVGGSEGGVPTGKAVWLANRGYAALALAYFNFDDLPRALAGIPLEYFGQALTWMSRRPEVDPSRLAVMGTSRGGELALQLGSMYPA